MRPRRPWAPPSTRWRPATSTRRATLAFIEHRDVKSLADICRTLELEPRHFGAVSGFGQICLRQGCLNEARAAFQIALALNPHLEDLREVLDDLGPKLLMLHRGAAARLRMISAPARTAL